MISFILRFKYPLAVIAMLLALSAYGQYKKWQGASANKTKVKIERLEDANAQQQKDLETRRKQNEILMRDVTPTRMHDILHASGY